MKEPLGTAASAALNCRNFTELCHGHKQSVIMPKKRDEDSSTRPNAPPAGSVRGEQPDEPLPLLTTRDVMQLLNLSRTKVWQLVTSGELPAYKLGGDYRYIRSEIMEWVKKHRVRATSGESHE